MKKKLGPPKDTFLRLGHDWENAKKFMVHNFENTASWENQASNT